MTPITIIAIVVVAILTVIIFGLTWLGFSSCIKAYRIEVGQGRHDDSIMEESGAKDRKKRKKGGLVGIACSYAVLLALSGLFASGIVYRARGENFSINDHTALVIKTGSMSGFHDDEIAERYVNDESLHFDVGDICVFDVMGEDDEPIEGDVYGYRYRDLIITHRLVGIHEESYEFRGDNNPVSDMVPVAREDIVYHYTGTKVPAIGAFVLYAQSYFGIWSISGIACVAVFSEIAYARIGRIDKERAKAMSEKRNDGRKVLARFRRRDGSEAVIYERKGDASNGNKEAD